MDIKKIRQIAAVCHEANRAYCASLGDQSQQSWEYAPEWQKDSAVSGVIHAVMNPDAGPEASHKSWCDQKLREGWKVGPVKDPELKEHPCLVDYDQLPVEQRAKDRLFIAIVKALKDA